MGTKEYDVEKVKRQFEINLFGTVYCSVLSAYHMSKNEGKNRGVIINISSITGEEAIKA